MAYKDLDDFIDLLWDFDDGRSRKHWEDRGYRVLYKRSVKIVETWCGQGEAGRFQERVKTIFPAVNWVVPYPNHTVFWQHTKQHQRMWLSVFHAQIQVEAAPGQPLEWTELLRAQSGQAWSIGRSKQGVLKGVPEDPKEIVFDIDKLKESVMRKWQRYQAQEAAHS
ncbi:hypothetical protein BKA66DRAFT_448656 [Pyrenochaeta sp. MPI-SDFR-AT-0127]|nr:hypothetical protein BKA66DRAFT_448656 [Pyrenochaeta sp. MPI-SDFR-AT-0127]